MLQQAAPIPKTEFNRDAHTYEWDDLQVELCEDWNFTEQIVKFLILIPEIIYNLVQ